MCDNGTVAGGVDDVQTLLLSMVVFSSSSNDMICGRLDVDLVVDLRSLLLLTVGTAMIISFCRGSTISAAGATFKSELSTVMANSMEPRPWEETEKC